MDSMLAKLEGLQSEIEKLQTEQAASLEKWQKLVDQAKLRLGIS